MLNLTHNKHLILLLCYSFAHFKSMETRAHRGIFKKYIFLKSQSQPSCEWTFQTETPGPRASGCEPGRAKLCCSHSSQVPGLRAGKVPFLPALSRPRAGLGLCSYHCCPSGTWAFETQIDSYSIPLEVTLITSAHIS